MNTTITRDTLVSALQSMIPEFKITREWTSGPDGDLGYPIISDLGRYICEQASYGDYEELQRGMYFLEVCLENGDSYTRDLVRECLETLYNSCQYMAEIAPRFGSQTRTVWEALLRDWR
jgi:hypothetical protein